MPKKYIVRLTQEERGHLHKTIKKLSSEQTLNGKKRANPPAPKLLNGEREAKIIAARLGSPPPGYANWSLRLLARHVVELEIVPTISHETVRQVIKKTG